ncbi:MAG TPA: hypothetical protein VIJ31_17305 [Acidothermaceae bacterium]
MTRDELAHILRSASRIIGEQDIVVIGSQSILGSFTDSELPDPAIASIEADLAFLDDPDNAKADKVDGAIGEDSQFHATFGYYGQGVSVTTALLPAGWRDRVVVFDNADTQPGRGLCLDPHDLVVCPNSPLVARKASNSLRRCCAPASSTPTFSAGAPKPWTRCQQCDVALLSGSRYSRRASRTLMGHEPPTVEAG